MPKVTVACAVLAFVLIVVQEAGASPQAIRIVAPIDGISDLHVRGNTVQWHHLAWAAPGRLGFGNAPTYVNDDPWYPIWPDVPDAENRDCNCFSSVYAGLAPGLPMGASPVSVNVIAGLGSVTATQIPSAANSYTLIVRFDDPEMGGHWYTVDLSYDAPNPVLWPMAQGGNDHYYETVWTPSGVTWDEARARTSGRSWQGTPGHLATVNSQAEDDWISAAFQNLLTFWLGAYQLAGTSDPAAAWHWVTGETWQYTNWAPGEPNDWGNYPGGPDALGFIGSEPNKWNDIPPAFTNPGFVVEYEDLPVPTTPTTWGRVKAERR